MISLWSATNSSAKISVIYSRLNVLQYLHTFLWVGLQPSVLLKKFSKCIFLVLVRLETWALTKQKNFFAIFLLFFYVLSLDWTFFVLDNQVITHLWESFHSIFTCEEFFFILVAKSLKKFLPLCPFLLWFQTKNLFCNGPHLYLRSLQIFWCVRKVV